MTVSACVTVPSPGSIPDDPFCREVKHQIDSDSGKLVNPAVVVKEQSRLRLPSRRCAPQLGLICTLRRSAAAIRASADGLREIIAAGGRVRAAMIHGGGGESALSSSRKSCQSSGRFHGAVAGLR